MMNVSFRTFHLSSKYGDREARELWPQLQRVLPKFFDGLSIVPALIHGDLWSGNAAANSQEPGTGESRYNNTIQYSTASPRTNETKVHTSDRLNSHNHYISSWVIW